MRKLLFIFLSIAVSSLLCQGQSFAPTSDNLHPLYSGQIKWADLDNDNDLDLIYLGFENGGNQYFVKVYENNNGSFSSRDTSLPSIRNGSFALGDYDNDGDLDVILSGLGNTGNISVLYDNNGAFSFTLKQSFPGLINVAASWFDIDNDQDLDFLLAGSDDNSGGPDPFVFKMLVYENVNGNFSIISGTNLPPCTQCSFDWADSNGDGYIDVLITGLREGIEGHTNVYLNNGDKTFSVDQNSIFKYTYNGDAKWGDFNNDGFMDAMLSGVLSDGKIITTIYKNIGGVLREEKDISIKSTGENFFCGTAWVDYNNDGLLDILVTGRGISIIVLEYNFKLYKNNGDGTFTEVTEPNFSGISDSSVDFGDFDNDGDVDFCFSGISPTGPKTGIYKNNLINGSFVSNSKPNAPIINGFTERFFRKQITLKWPNGSDIQTPSEGLSYNFYLKNGISKIVAPTSNFTSGYVMTTNPFNGHGRISVVNDIPEGNNTWAVQTIDGGKSGSLFSSEKTFYQINGPEAKNTEIIDVQNIKLNWIDNSSIETSYLITRSTEPTLAFAPLITLPQNTATYIDNNPFLTDTYYYYRVYASNATKTSAYDSLYALIPTAPTNLLAKPINATKINLTWVDLSQYESGYEIQRKIYNETNFQAIDTLAPNTTAYSNIGLNEGTLYEYRVRALISNGGSAFSNISSAQTNFKPLGSNFSKEIFEDKTLFFGIKDFTDAFSDPDGGDMLAELMIASLPSKGTLQLNNLPVIAGQIIPQIKLNDLQFIPIANANGISTFSFYNNDGKDNSTTTYTATINIIPVNDAPTFSIPSTVEVNEDFTTAVKIIPSVSPIPQDELSQVVTYSILPIVSNKVTVTVNSNTGEINFIAVANEFGEVQFVLTANDGQSDNNIFSDTVKLLIKAVNDAPVLSPIPDQAINYQSNIIPIAFTVTDVDNPLTSIIVSASSDNPLLLKNENITIAGTGQDKSIVILLEDYIGEAMVTITANDGLASISKQFKLKVIPVTGTSESSNLNIRVFPNPFSTIINILMEKPYKEHYLVILSDLLGRELSRHDIASQETTISLNALQRGIYIMSIFEDNGVVLFRKRIIKD